MIIVGIPDLDIQLLGSQPIVVTLTGVFILGQRFFSEVGDVNIEVFTGLGIEQALTLEKIAVPVSKGTDTRR